MILVNRFPLLNPATLVLKMGKTSIRTGIFFCTQLKRQEMPPIAKDEGKKEYKKVRKSLVTSGFF